MDRSGSGRDHDGRRAGHRSRARAIGQKGGSLLTAAALLAFAQVEPGAKPPANPPAKITAGEILDRAIQAQGMPAGTDPAADLPLAVHLVVHTQYTNDKGDMFSLNVERKFLGRKDDEGLIWTRVEPTSDKESTTISGFDGSRPWLWSKKSGLRWLNEAGGETDRAQLEKDLATTALLTRAFLLRNLPTQLKELARLDDATSPGPIVTDLPPCWVIEGKVDLENEGRKKPATFRLFFEQKTAWLQLARVTIEGDTPMQIRFRDHEVEDGLLVPGKIVLTWKDDPKSAQTFSVTTLELAPKLTQSDFAPPKK